MRLDVLAICGRQLRQRGISASIGAMRNVRLRRIRARSIRWSMTNGRCPNSVHDIGVPTPAIHAVFRYHVDSHRLPALLSQYPDVVIKPSMVPADGGFLVFVGSRFRRKHANYQKNKFTFISRGNPFRHVFAWSADPIQPFCNRPFALHPAFDRISYKRGMPAYS